MSQKKPTNKGAAPIKNLSQKQIRRIWSELKPHALLERLRGFSFEVELGRSMLGPPSSAQSRVRRVTLALRGVVGVEVALEQRSEPADLRQVDWRACVRPEAA